MSSSIERLSAWLKRNAVAAGLADAGGSDGGPESAAANPVATAAAAATGSYRLEPTVSNVTSHCRQSADPDESHVVGFAAMVPCKCRCRTCEKCGPILGWRVRQCLLSKADRFSNPAMLSLTVDRKRFESPQDAHEKITDGRYIPRLLRLLGIKTWFWVLEFQTKSGEGWPHWHVLIDLADVSGRLDLSHAWRLWRDKWGLGGLDLSVKRSFADRKHAVFYVTKYLTKMPEAFPVWVIQCKHMIRFVGGCKALGTLTGRPVRDVNAEPDDEAEDPDAQLKLPWPRTAFIVRMARCEQTASIFCVDGDCLSGDGSWTWIGTANASPDDLVEMAEQGLISLRVASVDWGDIELWAITNRTRGGVVSALRRLQGELADRDVGYAQEWITAMDERERQMLLHHQRFWQGKAVA